MINQRINQLWLPRFLAVLGMVYYWIIIGFTTNDWFVVGIKKRWFRWVNHHESVTIMLVKHCHFYHPFSWEWLVYTKYKHGDDWGIVNTIVLTTLKLRISDSIQSIHLLRFPPSFVYSDEIYQRHCDFFTSGTGTWKPVTIWWYGCLKMRDT